MRNLLLAAVCLAPIMAHAQTLNSNNNNGGSNGNGNANANLNANTNTNTLTAGAASRSISRANSRSTSRSSSQAVTGASTSSSAGGTGNGFGGAGYGYGGTGNGFGGAATGGNASVTGSSGNVTSFQDRLQAPAVSAPAIITSNGCAGSPISAGLSFQGAGATLGLGNGFDGACRIEAAMNNPVAREFLCLQSAATRQAIKNMALEGLARPCHADLAEVTAELAKVAPVQPTAVVATVPQYSIKPDWCGTWSAADGPLPAYCQ